MKALKVIKLILLPLLLIAGLVILVALCARPLRAVPDLHLNLRRIGLKNVLLAGGCLLCLAFALLCGVYTLFNLRQPTQQLLIPLLGFVLLGAGAWFCFTRAVRPLAYSYTTELSSFRPERFSGEQFDILPTDVSEALTGYSHYDDGTSESEQVTATYRSIRFGTERTRYYNSGLPSFTVGDWLCYEWEEGDTLYQVRLNRLTRQVVYSRFVGSDRLPAVAPQPMEETEAKETEPARTEETIPASETQTEIQTETGTDT